MSCFSSRFDNLFRVVGGRRRWVSDFEAGCWRSLREGCDELRK